jgi:hypothetical protein
VVVSEIIPHKKNKTAFVNYNIKPGKQYILDSIKTQIDSEHLVPFYNTLVPSSKIKNGQPYSSEGLENERDRITQLFRNNGIYHFQSNNITFSIDTLKTNHKANVKMYIKDRYVTSGDTSVSTPYRIYKIGRINVFTEDYLDKNNSKVIDSASYKNIHFYSYGKLRYRPKALADAIFLNKDDLYSDQNRNLTTRLLSNLKVFNYPNIQFVESKDSLNPNNLTANIFLKPRDKYSFEPSFNIIRSNIQDFGFTYSASFGIRNVFKGAEVLELSGRGNLGSSKDIADYDNRLFNLAEYGADLKLSVPRFLSPIGTRKWIPKYMIPSTMFSIGFSKQENIGLDKQNLLATIGYKWDPNKEVNARFDLLNIQYVRNVNSSNYFNVYRSSYNRLNEIAQIYNTESTFFDENNNLKIEEGTSGFINNVLSGNTVIQNTDATFLEVSRIEERRLRLTENNLISASSFQIVQNTQKDVYDNSFYILKGKFESAGATLSMLSNLDSKNKGITQGRTFYDVEYSQYGKVELEFIKHWELSRKRAIATRLFSGIAVPYNNSKNIPFSRSYFGGGANDNRAWQPYRLGPGRSGSLNDFNEANFKLAFNIEYRFNIYQKFKGALFIDGGNIWNVFDDIKDQTYTFNGISSLEDIAIGSGFGLRYDLSFFVLRMDVGFKNYNPAKKYSERWKNEYNFSSSVINIGINYPF